MHDLKIKSKQGVMEIFFHYSMPSAYPLNWRAVFFRANFMDHTFESDRYITKFTSQTPLNSILLDNWNTILATETWHIAILDIKKLKYSFQLKMVSYF
jgi:hypothetical protein